MKTDSTATAIDALQARVKELEATNRTAEDERAKYEARATHDAKTRVIEGSRP